jgi:Kdo2-lipid IVA lauroyltransferase/acyltransferase
MKRAVWFLELIAFVIVSIPFAILPLKWSKKAGELLGLFVFYLWQSRRRIAIQNLKAVISSGALSFPEPAEQLIRDNFKNLGKTFSEVVRLYYHRGDRLMESVEIVGVEHFRDALSKGRGILFITGHCGNWELMAMTVGVRLHTVSVVARPLDNPYINRFIENVRKKYGNGVIYKRGALKPILQTLKNNDIVGILIDQAVKRDEGFVMDFLGIGAWTMKMPALIARKTGATVLPTFIHRTEKGHTITINPAVELSSAEDKDTAVVEDTKRFSWYIEEYIRGHSTEWLWIHKRWKRVIKYEK